jgi:WD40 repeat protein
VWDAKDGTLLQTLHGHIDIVGDVFFFHNDNNRAFSIVRDRGYSEVFVWDLESGTKLYEFSGNEAVLSANDCVLFVANSDDDMITSYSMNTGYKLKDYTGIPAIDIEFPPSKSQIYTLNIDASQQRIISSGGSGVAVVWDISSTEPILKIDAHKSRIFVSEFSPKSEYIFTAGDIEGTVKLWDTKSGQLLFQRQEKDLSTLRSALFSSDGKYVAYIISGGLRVINLETFEVVVNEDTYIYYDMKLSLTKDPNIFAIEVLDKLCFFEFGTGKKTKELSSHAKTPGLHSLGFLHEENTMDEQIVGENYIFSIDHPENIHFNY